MHPTAGFSLSENRTHLETSGTPDVDRHDVAEGGRWWMDGDQRINLQDANFEDDGAKT